MTTDPNGNGYRYVGSALSVPGYPRRQLIVRDIAASKLTLGFDDPSLLEQLPYVLLNYKVLS